MASSFGRYTGGIEASTGGLVAASGQMANQTAQTIAGFGQNIAQGLQAYNENSAKSEMANAKIQMLGQEVANKIAMYSKDPEIAQSGILDGLIQTGEMLSEAPTKGFAQRAQIAMGAEAKLSGFGGQLQEMMFLRGREMERVSEEGLRKFAGETTVTSPRFSKAEEFKADPNLTLEENKAKALGYLNKVRALNPKLQGTDQDFLANWLTTAEQDIAKADPTKVHPTVISSMLEQIQAEKRIQKSNADAAKTGLVEDFLARGKMSSKADYDKTIVSAVDQFNKNNATQPPQDVSKQGFIDGLLERKRILQSRLESDDRFEPAWIPQLAGKTVVAGLNILENAESMKSLARGRKMVSGEKITPDVAKEIVRNATGANGWLKAGMGLPLLGANIKVLTDAIANTLGVENLTIEEKKNIQSALNDETAGSELGNEYRGTFINKTERDEISDIDAQITRLQRKPVVKKPVNAVTPLKNVAPIPMGEVVLGSMEETRNRTVAERQREVADFVTSRMGAIDPTDPERKRRLPVAGFDKFYKGLVPEAEIREFTTDSGIRMIHANGKWEVIKSADKMTPAEMRKANIGVFGKQTADGRLVPSEFIPDSGVFVGGLFSGSDAAVDKYQEELPKLIDARRGVKELQRINDLVGEAFMPVERGKALVEEMNLSAMLRTDIVGVGTVSNYEQKLIKDVTENSVNFFSLESKDRAILIALAERVDRRIKNLSAAHGLTIRIEDDRGMSKYQALREQYLREKGLL